MKLAKERKIDLDVNDVAQSNLVTFAYGSPSCKSPTTKQRANTTFIRFGSLEPVQVQLSQKASDYNSNDDEKSTMDEEEGWTLVTHLTFTDEDLLLGSKPHNRPLYVSGYVREQKIDRILIDGGSAINILPKMTMRRLGLAMEELSHSRLVIQGFNQGGQRAVGMIHLELIIGELTSNVLFHVIDAKTTYNMLLGSPWIHGNGIVPSTLHQCFKYLQGGIKKFTSKWDGPYVVQEVYTNGAYKLIDQEGVRIGPINGKFLKRFYA
ncbi:hypothetical protein ACB092_06G161700 [Castanea dentata]